MGKYFQNHSSLFEIKHTSYIYHTIMLTETKVKSIDGGKMIRKIIRIDKEKCNGCGACADACHEGAIDIINGKAELVREHFCDGLGDCLPECPTGAISFEEREAPEYDEEAVKRSAKNLQNQAITAHASCPGSKACRFSDQNTQIRKTIFSHRSGIQSSRTGTDLWLSWHLSVPHILTAQKFVIAADCTAYTRLFIKFYPK